MASTPVVGRQLPGWKRVGAKDIALYVAVGLALGGCVWWFVHLSRDYGHLLDPGHALATLAGTLFFGLLFLPAAVGLAVIPLALFSTYIESACPCCGTVDARMFGGTGPTRCASCRSYLRADGLRVSEEELAAVDTRRPTYSFEVTRDPAELVLPAMCAVCGSPDTPYILHVEPWPEPHESRSGGFSRFTFAVADVFNMTPRTYGSTRFDWTARTGSSGPAKPTKGEQLDEALRALKLPVCVPHSPPQDGQAVARCRDGSLLFASYRYYKQFLALNPPPPKP